MKALQRFVVLVLLGVWSFPAVSMAQSGPAPSGQVSQQPRPATQAPSPMAATSDDEAASLAAREQKGQDAQNFRGGAAYVYLGSGALAVLVVVLLILLI